MKRKNIIALGLAIIMILTTSNQTMLSVSAAASSVKSRSTTQTTKSTKSDDSEKEKDVEKEKKSESDSVTKNDADADLSEDNEAMSSTQQNALNMLNYVTVLTQEINESKQSRVYLESAYSAIINNIYPNSVDSMTLTQMNSILDTLESYRMITEKRERLEYLYEQNQALAIRSAIPDSGTVMNVVRAGTPDRMMIAVIHLAVDSVSSYESAKHNIDLQYLQDGWELKDEESEYLHQSRKSAFSYMVNMVRDNSLPGDYALTEQTVQDFVTWKNKTNLTSKMEWMQDNEEVYSQFGPYWLEMVSEYYEAGDYKKCLEAIDHYESITTRIFRKDHDYAQSLPMVIIAAGSEQDSATYEKSAVTYCERIMENTDDDDWILRYFAAETYLGLYGTTNNETYLQKAYDIAFGNVNVLADEQKKLNETYLADVEEVSVGKSATKREEKEAKQYNKMLKEERKTALPPINEAFYLNCDLLFLIAEEKEITAAEQQKVDAILHEDNQYIFLTEALDNKYAYNDYERTLTETTNVVFSKDSIKIPVLYLTDRAELTVTITSSDGTKTIIDDWTVSKVNRPKKSGIEEYTATFVSKTAKKYEYQDGDHIEVEIVPIEELKDAAIVLKYHAVAEKKMWLFSDIKFEAES